MSRTFRRDEFGNKAFDSRRNKRKEKYAESRTALKPEKNARKVREYDHEDSYQHDSDSF